jgi:hypothetical protein
VKKITALGITFLVFLVSLAGCNDENSEIFQKIPQKILIYCAYSVEFRNITDDDVPLLVIEDETGIELFMNMLINSTRIPGALDVLSPPFIAMVHYENSIEGIDLHLSYPDDNGNSYYGMFIEHYNTHAGYEINVEYVEAFLQAYRTDLYDLFVLHLERRFSILE